MDKIKKIRGLYKKFMLILSPNHKKWAMIVLLMSVVGALLETLGVSIILPLVQAMLNPMQLLEIEVFNRVYVYMNMNEPQDLIGVIAFGVVIIYVVKNLYLILLSYARVKFSTKVQKELSIRMLNSYLQKSYSFFRMNNTSTLMRGVNDSVAGVYSVLLYFLRILVELLTIVCLFLYVILTEWEMAVAMVILVAVCLLLIMSIFKKMMQKAGEKFFYNARMVSQWSMQLFFGIKEILVLNRKEYFVENYKKAYEKRQDGAIKQIVAGEIPAYIIEGICVVGMILVVWWKVGTLEAPENFIPVLATFAMAAVRLLPSVGRISSYINGCLFNIPAVEEVYNNIVETEKFKCEEKKEQNSKVKFEKELQVKDIVWKYPDGEEYVLNHITLNIKKGELVAFVGPSGAGKSTLADIILGLFYPQQGGVFLDGHDIGENREAVSKIIGFVPQSVYLIDDTIRRNIAFGIYDDEISDEAVWMALDQAQMKEYVKGLPLGLDTMVGERGVRFSGGQAQRLAIARALYTDPDILVLDEATSALDSETEKAVMEAIDALQGQKTLIIIAHRLSTVKNCDRIYEISNGQAVEKKYEDLI